MCHLLDRARSWLVVMVTCLLVAATGWSHLAMAAGPVVEPPNADQPGFYDPGAIHGVYLPIDRKLARGLSRVRERIEAGKYTEAVSFLGDVLTSDEDSFVVHPDQSSRLLGLKSLVRQLISDLSPEGRSAYELSQSTRARKLVAEAIKAGNYGALTDVVRQYLHTPAGYEAALLLAQRATDLGNPAAAARIYQRVRKIPQAAELYEPQLSLLLAASWAAQGEADRERQVLEELQSRADLGELVVGGTNARGTPGAAPQLATLDPLLASELQLPLRDPNWTTRLGSRAGNLDAPGGPPHNRLRWQVRVANHPRLESYLEARQEVLNRAGVPLVGLVTPLAVGDVVITKTADMVVAINWQSGKRIWETRSYDENAFDQLLAGLDHAEADAPVTSFAHALEQRIWNDALAAALSSDGERVFTIRGLPIVDRNRQISGGRLPIFGRRLAMIEAMTNRLAAYELATEGKLVWEVDGRRVGGDLAGIFFLGAPLAVDDTLYVLGEIKSAVYLVALDPRTGDYRWRQLLLSLERGVHLDLQRSRAGAEPSLANDILVCPTSAGAVVAFDLFARSLAWAYLYPRSDTALHQSGLLLQHQVPTADNELIGRWLDGTPRIHGNRVIVTPRDSPEIHCLDLETGELIWKRNREKNLFVGCIDQEAVLLVAAHTVSALSFKDGRLLWTQRSGQFPQETLVSGRGLLSQGKFYLPLTSGQLAAINMADGKMVIAPPQHQEVMGNLICHRGAVISQSVISIDKFEQRSAFLRRTTEALRKNANDPVALRDRGELALASGQFEMAAATLQRAYKADPADLDTRQLLAESLLHLLKRDYSAYRDQLPLLEAIVDDPAKRLELMRLDAEGLWAIGQYREAFAVLLRIADQHDWQSWVQLSAEHTIRVDRWVRGQLQVLWKQSSPDVREEIRQELVSRSQKAMASGLIADQQRYLGFFAGMPMTDEVAWHLSRQLVDRRDLPAAEMALFRLHDSTDESYRAGGAVLTLQLMDRPGNKDELVWQQSQIRKTYPVVLLPDGRLTADWLSELFAEQNPQPPTSMAGWSAHRIESREIDLSSTDAGGRQSRHPPTMQRLRIEQARHVTAGPTHFRVSTDLSRLAAINRWGEVVWQLNVGRQLAQVSGRVPRFQTSYAARLGDRLYVNVGQEIVAVDTGADRQSGGRSILWRSEVPTRVANRKVGSNRGPYHHASERRRVVDEKGRIVCTLGPATAEGVVYQNHEALQCVDPLTGETLWSRTDIPPGAELLGDERLVLVKPASATKAILLNMVDGVTVGQCDVPQVPWLIATGHRVTTVERQADKHFLVRIVNLLTGKAEWEHRCDSGTRFRVLEPDAVAILEASGEFRFVDAATGNVLLAHRLQPQQALESIQVVRDDDRLFLFASTRSDQRKEKHVAIGVRYALINGLVYAFDLNDGKPLWPVPATVKNQGIALDQPVASPLLVFASRVMRQDTNGNQTNLKVLCLEKVSGRSVYRNPSRPDTLRGEFRIQIERGHRPSVAIRTSAQEIRLELTETPRPPEPPAQHLAETRLGTSGGLWELGRKVGREIVDAFDNPLHLNRAMQNMEVPFGPELADEPEGPIEPPKPE